MPQAASEPVHAGSATRLMELPLLRAPGAEQMARDARLLDEVACLAVRRYLWSPAAVSLGKFQKLAPQAVAALAEAGIDVVRRPSGGRLVLHGEGFEWSFAVAAPGVPSAVGTHAAYRVVHEAMAAALVDCGVAPDATRDEPYTRSALCFASVLRHDLLVRGAKAVAVAQVRHGDHFLVHGSVLERRPPAGLVAAVEAATGERWCGEGLAGSAEPCSAADPCGSVEPAGEALWRAFVARLRATALGDSPDGPDGPPPDEKARTR